MNTSYFIKANWPAPNNVIAGTTLRMARLNKELKASFNLADHIGDDREKVFVNREIFKKQLNLYQEPYWLHQVHGNCVVKAPFRKILPTADACVTKIPNTVCIILTADCLPIFFTSEKGDFVGIAHAGWKGMLAGIIEETISSFEIEPQTLMVWLGPAISQSAFEVGDEVRDQFLLKEREAEQFFLKNPNKRWQADLYGLAKLKLNNYGVKKIFGGQYCTFKQQKKFFSYRRNRQSGRMANFIYMNNDS